MIKKSLAALVITGLVAGSAAMASAAIVSTGYWSNDVGFQFPERSIVCNDAAAPDRLAELRTYRNTLRREKRVQADDLAIRVADISRPGVAHRLGPADRLAYMRNRHAAMQDTARSRRDLRKVRQEIRFVTRALKDPVSTCN